MPMLQQSSSESHVKRECRKNCLNFWISSNRARYCPDMSVWRKQYSRYGKLSETQPWNRKGNVLGVSPRASKSLPTSVFLIRQSLKHFRNG